MQGKRTCGVIANQPFICAQATTFNDFLITDSLAGNRVKVTFGPADAIHAKSDKFNLCADFFRFDYCLFQLCSVFKYKHFVFRPLFYSDKNYVTTFSNTKSSNNY